MRPTDDNETSKDLLKRVTSELQEYLKEVQVLKDDEIAKLKDLMLKFTKPNFQAIEYKGIDKDLVSHSNLNW